MDFLVMEYLEVETVAVLLPNGPLAMEQTSEYAFEIAGAPAAAQHRGIYLIFVIRCEIS